MGAMQTITADRHGQILEDSVHQSRPLVLTHNGPDGWRTFKASFAASGSAAPTLTVRLELPAAHAPSVAPKVGDALGGTFRLGHKKCMFSTALLNIRRDGDTEVWTLRRPEQLQQLQRRAYERSVPMKGSVIAVRFWRETPGGDPSVDARAVRHGQLEDLSAGGMRVKIADPKDLELDRTYRCVFTPRLGKPALVLDAVLRHREAGDEGRSSLGFQFVGLETSEDGMKLLDRLVRVVQQFHRTEARE